MSFQDDQEILEKYLDENLNTVLGLRLAERYISLDNLEGAHQILSEFLESHPNNATALFLLGEIAFKEGNNEKAKSQYEETIKLDPTFTTAYHRLIMISSDEGDNSGAADIQNLLTLLNPLDDRGGGSTDNVEIAEVLKSEFSDRVLHSLDLALSESPEETPVTDETTEEPSELTEVTGTDSEDEHDTVEETSETEPETEEETATESEDESTADESVEASETTETDAEESVDDTAESDIGSLEEQEAETDSPDTGEEQESAPTDEGDPFGLSAGDTTGDQEDTPEETSDSEDEETTATEETKPDISEEDDFGISSAEDEAADKGTDSEAKDEETPVGEKIEDEAEELSDETGSDEDPFGATTEEEAEEPSEDAKAEDQDVGAEAESPADALEEESDSKSVEKDDSAEGTTEDDTEDSSQEDEEPSEAEPRDEEESDEEPETTDQDANEIETSTEEAPEEEEEASENEESEPAGEPREDEEGAETEETEGSEEITDSTDSTDTIIESEQEEITAPDSDAVSEETVAQDEAEEGLEKADSSTSDASDLDSLVVDKEARSFEMPPFSKETLADVQKETDIELSEKLDAEEVAEDLVEGGAESFNVPLDSPTDDEAPEGSGEESLDNKGMDEDGPEEEGAEKFNVPIDSASPQDDAGVDPPADFESWVDKDATPESMTSGSEPPKEDKETFEGMLSEIDVSDEVEIRESPEEESVDEVVEETTTEKVDDIYSLAEIEDDDDEVSPLQAWFLERKSLQESEEPEEAEEDKEEEPAALTEPKPVPFAEDVSGESGSDLKAESSDDSEKWDKFVETAVKKSEDKSTKGGNDENRGESVVSEIDRELQNLFDDVVSSDENGENEEDESANVDPPAATGGLKLNSDLATFTLAQIYMNQGQLTEALSVLDLLDKKGENKEKVESVREEIKAKIEARNK